FGWLTTGYQTIIQLSERNDCSAIIGNRILIPAQLELFENPYARRIILFLTNIGIPVRAGARSQKPFLPGIWVEDGGLIADASSLLYPGDLLHEAGHLAVMPPDRRRKSSGDIAVDPGEEMAAQAWSYAAAV